MGKNNINKDTPHRIQLFPTYRKFYNELMEDIPKINGMNCWFCLCEDVHINISGTDDNKVQLYGICARCGIGGPRIAVVDNPKKNYIKACDKWDEFCKKAENGD